MEWEGRKKKEYEKKKEYAEIRIKEEENKVKEEK